MPKILIIEDDVQITRSLKISLKLGGFDVESAATLAEAWEKISAQNYQLLLLDIGLPDGNGLDFCQKVRDVGNDIPILLLSARTDEATVVSGISRGGDDYLRKPFGVEELKARMNKLIKRFSPPTHLIVFGCLVIDPAKRVTKVMDQIVSLGKKELDILIMLARKAGDIVTREHILSTLYTSSDPFDRTVDSHMSHLRKKIKEAAGSQLQITSVYGLGYRLERHEK